MKNRAFTVKHVSFGGGNYVLAASVFPSNQKELSADIDMVCKSDCNAVEIVVNQYADKGSFPADLAALKEKLTDHPLILSIAEEGTDQKIAPELTSSLLSDCADLVDIVSIETTDALYVQRAKEAIAAKGVKLMLSYQDMAGVADEADLLTLAKQLEEMGADLVRITPLAANDVDVIRIAKAARLASKEIGVPCCISAIGDVGLMMRLYAERCGNDFGTCRLYGESIGNLTENLEEYHTLRQIYDIDRGKLISKEQYKMNGAMVGGEKYLSCMMIKEGSRAAVLEKARDVLQYDPDIVEWRLDYINPMLDADFAEEALKETTRQLSMTLEKRPILMTFRIKEQGGLRAFPRELRLRMVKACISTGCIAIADVEIDSDEAYVREIREACDQYGTKLLLSFHDWDKVPSDEFMINEVRQALEKGADIPKLYLTANSYQDVIRIARTAKKLREEGICEKPYCICGMNDIAMITRIIGGQCGSDFGYFTYSDVRGGYEEDDVYFKELLDVFDMKAASGYADPA